MKKGRIWLWILVIFGGLLVIGVAAFFAIVFHLIDTFW